MSEVLKEMALLGMQLEAVTATLPDLEISFEESSNRHGFQVNIVTTAKTPEESKLLLEKLGFPFQRSN